MAASDNLSPAQFPPVNDPVQRFVDDAQEARKKRMGEDDAARAEKRRVRMTTNPWDPEWR